MKKVAFVIPWYSDIITGGAETETKNLVKKLIEKGIDVEILTTCVEKFTANWNVNFFKEGKSIEGGVPIRRFKVKRRDTKKFDEVNLKLMNGEKISIEEEKIFFNEMVRSTLLEKYIEENYDNYSFFCYIPYMFGTTYWGAKKSRDKTILIPCLHDESYAYMDLLKETFTLASGCIFLSNPEKELAEKIFNLKDKKIEVIGAGIEINKISSNANFKEKYRLKQPYILYAGRKDEGKNINLLLKYFSIYSERNDEKNLVLVLIGGGKVEIPKNIEEKVYDLGFVDINDKNSCYENSIALVNPSNNESFSIVIMESWLMKRPVIVSEKCEVTKRFAIESNGGLYFGNYLEFEEILNFYLENENIATKMGINGQNYVKNNFDRNVVAEKYIKFFNELNKMKNRG